MTIRIFVDGVEWIDEGKEVSPVKVDMWYDRHRREWVIYPVDEDGNQYGEAQYGFSKAEALRIKKELETEYNL